MLRTLLRTCSKAAIAAHQFIQEEAKNSRGTGFKPASAPRCLLSTGHCSGHSLDAALWKTITKRVEAQAACISFEC